MPEIRAPRPATTTAAAEEEAAAEAEAEAAATGDKQVAAARPECQTFICR